nr:ead/Ea22-like family protein [Citrobacter sedlakii]
MSNIDKQALIAKIKKQTESFDTVVLKEDEANALLDELEAMHKYAKDRDAENEGLMLTVGRLRVERDAAEKRIAELSHHLQCAHGFIEHTEAFGHEASNGILCCGDAQWNIDESKSVLAAAGKGE